MKIAMRVGIMVALIVMVAANARAGDISGVVQNQSDGRPIAGVTVRAITADLAEITDDLGRFVFRNVDADQLTITVSHVGFITREDIVLFIGNSNKISLTPAVSVLNSVVVSGNRYERAAFQVPQAIMATMRSDIQKHGYVHVTDAMREFPGIDMNDAGPFRARPVIRGLFGTRILTLVDGERLNDHREVVDFAGIGMSLVDINEIERIEVVSGPSSVLYGSDAMAGVINVITTPMQFTDKLAPWGSYAARYSSVDQQTTNRVDLGLMADQFSVSGGFSHREAGKDYLVPDGFADEDERYNAFRQEFYDSLNTARGTSYGSDRIANSQAIIKNYDFRGAFRPNDQHHLEADFGSMRASDVGYPGVPNSETPFLFFYPHHDRDNASLKYTGTGLNSVLQHVEAKAYYQKLSKEFLTDFYDNVSFPAGPGATGYVETSLSNTEVEKIGLNLQGMHQFSEAAMLTVGVDAWQEDITGGSRTITRFEGFSPFPVFDTSMAATVPKNSWVAIGGFAFGEFKVGDVEVDAGLRLDNFSVSTDETVGYVDDEDEPLPADDETFTALNGSFGVTYPLAPAVNAVANVGTAYRVPNSVERFFYGSASGRLTRPNPNIDPERAITGSAGIKAVHPQVNYSLIGFYSDYSNFTQLRSIGQDPMTHQTLWQYQNVEDIVIYGFEAYIESQFDNGMYGNLGFSYQHGENKSENEPIFVSPVKVSLTGGYRHPEHGLFGEVTLRVVGDQDRVPDESALEEIATAGYMVVNATVGAEIVEGVRLSITGNNLLDEVYSAPFNGRNPDNPLPEPGRGIVVSLSTSLGKIR